MEASQAATSPERNYGFIGALGPSLVESLFITFGMDFYCLLIFMTTTKKTRDERVEAARM